MTFGIPEAIAAVSVVASLVGAGATYYASQESAKSQSAIANYNYQLELDAAEQQRKQNIQNLTLQNAQLSLQQTNAQIESSSLDLQDVLLDQQRRYIGEQTDLQRQQLDQQRAIIAENKSTSLANAEIAAREAMEQQRRTQAEEDQVLAAQRAVYAGSGLLLEGTPLAVLGDTAALYSLQMQDDLYQGDMERRQHLITAAAYDLDTQGIDLQEQLLDLEAQLQYSQIDVNKAALDISKAGARIDQNQYDLQKSLLTLDSYSAESEYSQSVRQSEINKYAGESAAAGTSLTGYGNLLSSTGSSALNAANWYTKYVDQQADYKSTPTGVS